MVGYLILEGQLTNLCSAPQPSLVTPAQLGEESRREDGKAVMCHPGRILDQLKHPADRTMADRSSQTEMWNQNSNHLFREIDVHVAPSLDLQVYSTCGRNQLL